MSEEGKKAALAIAEPEKCSECHGQGRVKVGWHPIAGSTYRIKVDYAPCHKCRAEVRS